MIERIRDTLFRHTMHEMNRIKRWSWFGSWIATATRVTSMAAVAVGIWSLLQPTRTFEQLAVGLATLVILSISGRWQKREKIGQEDVLLALEIAYPSTRYAASSLLHETERYQAEEEWKPYLEREVRKLASFERMRFRTRMSTAIVPTILAALILFETRPAIGTAITHVAKSLFTAKIGATLTIVQGGTSGDLQAPIKLQSDKPATIELLDKNLVEIVVLGGKDDAAPVVYLKEPGKGGASNGPAQIFQSFQLTPIRSPGDDESISRFVQSFAVKDSVDLFISAISGNKPLAHITVKTLPVPVVSLNTPVPLKEPWPDDQPLSLTIQADGKNPLALVNIIIRTGKRESRELVNSVLVEDKFSLTADYQLLLEPYLDSDLAEVEVIAEAIDRATPQPLIGRSKPLRFTTASAYGRYQQTLNTLREVKSLLDEAISRPKHELDAKVGELIRKAGEQSQDSPFFDAIDRIQISAFEEKLSDAKLIEDGTGIDGVSNELNDFLFDHEILDDRERDRDFFVATRGLSRLIEQERTKRPAEISTVVGRITSFLDSREARWKRRVARLGPDAVPKTWSSVAGDRPFHQFMNEIAKYDTARSTDAVPKSLEALSKAVAKFRDWISELEAAEDAVRAKQEQERQNGLASAQDELKELQKAQGQISSRLDRSASTDGKELAEKWPAIRMAQNGNMTNTNRLENKLRALSPQAATRIKAATEAMGQTLENGNADKFVQAESYSDLAGRLLRQAESATRESQSRQKSRGRRRRVTGDSYYGQSVVGGDIEIKREYEVDRRYREDILDEVRGSRAEGDDKTILDNYLRKTVR